MTEDYYKKVSAIKGWFDLRIVPILQIINEAQEHLKGDILEIGVHHGRSFLVLVRLLSEKQLAVACDCFAKQTANKGRSGHGDREVFVANINALASNTDQIKILEADSLSLSPEDYLALTEGELYRLVHVDGAHYFDNAVKDIQNSVRVLHPDGILMIDDVWNPPWPEVNRAFNHVCETGVLYPIAIAYSRTFVAINQSAYLRYYRIVHEELQSPELQIKELFGREFLVVGHPDWANVKL
jgi:SAM-dependent methyltransferase